MANVTDPLAAALHGTDPQNLMEYITRQKIYECRYWKEECFGLSAVDVLEKATLLKCIGGTFGANRQPTKFLCLTLKLLQIQPDDDLVNEFVANEDFKYVRALGVFYKRLTGRPADIYETLEPCYTDYRKLRYRDINEWKLVHVDELIHQLLTSSRVCGIALPRLPARKTLEDEGYLDGPRKSALSDVLENMTAEQYLEQKVQQGSEAAKALWEARQARYGASGSGVKRQQGDDDSLLPSKRSKKDDYGTLFKSNKESDVGANTEGASTTNTAAAPEEGSEEYWNEQRAKLGLKPLK